MEGNTLLEKEGTPDETRTYDRDFLQLAEQAGNVLEKLTGSKYGASLGQNDILFRAILKLNPFEKYKIDIEIERIGDSRSKLYMDIRTSGNLKVSYWKKKLTKFKEDFFDLLDASTLESREFKKIYEEHIDIFNKEENKKHLRTFVDKWGHLGIENYVMMIITLLMTVGMVFIFILTYLGLLFDRDALVTEVFVTIFSTIITIVATREYFYFKYGRMRLIGMTAPRHKVRAVFAIEDVIRSMDIRYIRVKTSIQPYEIKYDCKDPKFQMKIYFHFPMVLGIVIRPVIEENEAMLSRLMTKLDERFIEEEFSFYTIERRKQRKERMGRFSN